MYIVVVKQACKLTTVNVACYVNVTCFAAATAGKCRMVVAGGTCC